MANLAHRHLASRLSRHHRRDVVRHLLHPLDGDFFRAGNRAGHGLRNELSSGFRLRRECRPRLVSRAVHRAEHRWTVVVLTRADLARRFVLGDPVTDLLLDLLVFGDILVIDGRHVDGPLLRDRLHHRHLLVDVLDLLNRLRDLLPHGTVFGDLHGVVDRMHDRLQRLNADGLHHLSHLDRLLDGAGDRLTTLHRFGRHRRALHRHHGRRVHRAGRLKRHRRRTEERGPRVAATVVAAERHPLRRRGTRHRQQRETAPE